MHASSMENMQRCRDRYIGESFMRERQRPLVLDVGGANVNGTYRDVFASPHFEYVAADLEDGKGVDIVLSDPYVFPSESMSFDIVISGQTLEHSEFFWLVFAEMIRVLKEDGLLFLILPSSGPEHRYPVDCYRFYPDSFGALAKYAKAHVIDIWQDERGPWRDVVGVFSKTASIAEHLRKRPKTGTFWYQSLRCDDPGSAGEEVRTGEETYLSSLKRIHREFAPGTYLEIGVRNGRSLALSQAVSIGIDPEPDIDFELSENTTVYRETSDDFFASGRLKAIGFEPDLAFIDGMHHFEFALRDFMNLERAMRPDGLIVIDDIFPNHPSQAQRLRKTQVWTGDVWKLQSFLERVRSDLYMLALDTEPTGLVLIAGLDPSSRVLWDQYNSLVREFLETSSASPPESVVAREGAVSPHHDVCSTLLSGLRGFRQEGATPATIKSFLSEIRMSR